MQNFSLSHHLSCSPEDYWERSRGEDVAARVGEALEATVTPLGDDGVGGWQVIYEKELPGIMKRALGVENFQYDLLVEPRGEGEDVVNWQVTTPFLSDRVDVKGSTEVVAEEGGGCARTVDAQVRVKLALMGKKMESRLADRVQAFWEASAEAVAFAGGEEQ